MPIAFTTPAFANTGQIGGNQLNAQTVALSSGGYVVAWESSFGGAVNTFFQRYDALGAQVGAVTQIANPSQQVMLFRDIAVAGDGTFTIVTQGRIGPSFADERLFVNSYSETTGALSGTTALLNVTALGPGGTFGAQLVPDPTSPGTLTVLASVVDAGFFSDMLRAVVTTAGVVTVLPFVANNNHSGIGTLDATDGVNGNQFVLTSGGLLDTAGSGSIAFTAVRDVVSLGPGTIVVATSTAESPQVTLTMLTGTLSNFVNWGTTIGGASTNAVGFTTPGARVFDVELLDLGAGRFLIVWVADGGGQVGGVNNLQDGVYAQVFNLFTGGPEGQATQIVSFGTGPNDSFLQGIAVSADAMADGRVTLSLSYLNGLSGFDVFNTILDPRVAGINVVSSTALSETLVGTAFGDTFSNVSTGDRIFGGAGSDTVAFGTSAARSVDLQNPGNFPTNSFFLEGIENLTGSTNGDLLRGNAEANVLSGVGANDTLTGRDGDDSLYGGINDDLANGGNGEDLLDGGAGIDTLDGADGDDLLFGGADADRLLGGDANDALYGGDADDRLQGEAGDDALFGDAGNDILTGGAGDDEISGGVGLDTLRAEEGADSVYGGADNDTIFAHAGVALVDGGTGTDTLRLSGPLAVNTAGVHVDLTGVFDLLGLAAPLTRFAEEISGIENVTGGSGNDFITGDNAVNTLVGGQGSDTLVSGGGVDILFGGGGADVFVFTGTTGGADQVRDFSIGTDRIGLVDGAFADINSTNIASRLTINATGTVGALGVAQIVYDNSGAGFGQLFFDADGNGAGAAVLITTLTPTTGALVALTAADFLFI